MSAVLKIAKTFLTLVVFLSIALPVWANENALDQIQKTYETLESLNARFTQSSERHNFMGNKETVVQSGKLLIKKPGKLRWDYQKPQKKSYISNGQKLWIYTPDEKQVIESLWDPSAVALQFLLGKGDLKRDFDVKSISDKAQKKYAIKGGNWVYLEAKSEKQHQANSVQTLFLRYDKNSFLVTEAIGIDPIGSKTHWQFEKIKKNKPIKNRQFEFKIPKDVQIINY